MLTGIHERSSQIRAVLIDIDARMGQEKGDNGIVVMGTSIVNGSAAKPIHALGTKMGMIPENFLHLFYVTLLRGKVKTRGMHGK